VGVERFYGELARWWPQISPPEQYVEEAGEIARLLGDDVRTVLELGSGGGSNAVHLKDRYTLTLSDLSEEMLDVSRALNPECEHVQGDMRTLRLGGTFDAVLVHDAIDYMVTEEDLRAALTTAYAHCERVALFMPDALTETFEPSTEHGGSGDVRYLEWTYDPDPTDTWALTEYVFVLRDGEGVRTVHETHRTGLFGRATWLALLTEVGFADVRVVREQTTEDRDPRELFLGLRRWAP
jgi:SAM-dependent methyltransferase